jgi:hypothetical protein
VQPVVPEESEPEEEPPVRKVGRSKKSVSQQRVLLQGELTIHAVPSRWPASAQNLGN